MPPIQFEWDPIKNASNYVKHGYFLAEVTSVFDDPQRRIIDMERVDDEERFTILGNHDNRILSVTSTIRAGKVRLISARPASRKERRGYTAPNLGG